MALNWSLNFAAGGLNCHARGQRKKTAIYSTVGPVCITLPNKTAAGCYGGWQSGGKTAMANGRNKGNKGDSGRDAGGFIALPWTVLDCPAYARLSMHARALLLEVARQFVRDNNGRLLLSRAYLEPRGWKSVDMLTKAKRELLTGGFIFETVMGHRPNKASWYAVTWRKLDKLPGYDAGAIELFRQGAYKDAITLTPKPTRDALFERWRNAGARGKKLKPPHGHHLEMPSVGAGCPVH
jgi:hypothetical protein